MTKLSFQKMHGAGNDFIVLDARAQALAITPEQAKFLCDRHLGIGCDTLVILDKATDADVAVRFINGDGSDSATCGNATRCVADVVMRETGKDTARIATTVGVLTAKRNEAGLITVNMGTPKFGWNEIPLSESRNTMHLGLEMGLMADPAAVNMGNPHAIFFVRDLAHIKIAEWGAALEHHPLFPERANISAVQVMGDNHIKMAVWERGAGITLACGSAACAAVAAGVRRGLIHPECTVDLPGGTLEIHWKKNDGSTSGDIFMSGPVAYVFEGVVEI
ncbi:MAG: diaminopimelate epimerase [Rickettsiales bacterium]|nr:diaminopimelate epimerase [Rickettsiales bacterium]